jgi:hypothetical protein
MDFQDGLSALLPAPRDDEPASLRQDILDELADHLSCAYRGEVLRGTEASVARARVLERFGDPAAVARRLWLDAMKGKIMAQRVLVATCLVVTIASLLLAGMVWLQSVQAARQLALAEQRAAEAMVESRRNSAEMLKQLQVMAKGDKSTSAVDWIPVTFKLTQERIDGPPATGYKVHLGKGTGGSMRAGSINRESDDKGQVDFGVVQPGDWEFRIFQPSEDGRGWRTQGNINVLPATEVAKTIICPADYKENVPVGIRVDWPADLADSELQVAIVAQFEFRGMTYQPPLRWQLGAGPPFGPAPVRNFGCEPGGKVADVNESHFFLWRVVGKSDGGMGPIFADLSLSAPLPLGAPLPTSNIVQLAAGDYGLDRLVVLRPVRVKVPDTSVERFDFIAQVLRPRLNMEGQDRNRMRVHRLLAAPSEKGAIAPEEGTMEEGDYLSFSSSYRSLIKGRFAARQGESNEWVIPLPDELIKAVREKLKTGATAKKK